jgi:hypothetical protein
LGEHQHPRKILKHALERGNLVVAEITARELGGLDLTDALELTVLIAVRDRARGQRAGARWLQRWLDETTAATVDEAAMIAAALAALGGPGHAEALLPLRAVAARHANERLRRRS